MNVGDYVTIEGEQKTCYRVLRVLPGWADLYGGDPDPKGRRGYRSVRPERLKPALRKHLPKPVR